VTETDRREESDSDALEEPDDLGVSTLLGEDFRRFAVEESRGIFGTPSEKEADGFDGTVLGGGMECRPSGAGRVVDVRATVEKQAHDFNMGTPRGGLEGAIAPLTGAAHLGAPIEEKAHDFQVTEPRGKNERVGSSGVGDMNGLSGVETRRGEFQITTNGGGDEARVRVEHDGGN
jgi:hypothetical protein